MLYCTLIYTVFEILAKKSHLKCNDKNTWLGLQTSFGNRKFEKIRKLCLNLKKNICNETFLSDFQTTVQHKMKSKIMTMSAWVFAVITHQWTLGTARKCMQIRCKNSSILMEKNGKNFLPVESTKIQA